MIALHARNVSLREALQRVAAAARVHLSYSTELLPLDRSVCLSSDSVTLGGALAELLRGVSVVAVVAGVDDVVLTPVAAPRDSLPAGRATVLERVVVTGSATGAPQRGLPIAIDVLTVPRTGTRSSEALPQLLDAAVPGLWAWEPSPTSLLTRFGSVRGASSFGLSYPKIFLDGIELANPLVLTHLAADAVERLEVVRGPESAAIYGMDAISGVINIVTRHDGMLGGGPRAVLRSSFGMAESVFSPDDALIQEHSVGLRTGRGARTADLNATVGGLGPLLGGGPSRRVVASASGKSVDGRTLTTATVRIFAEQITDEGATLPLPGPDAAAPAASPVRPSAREYTAGVTSTFLQNDRWTHSAVLGFDANRLRDLPDEPTPGLPSSEQEESIDSGAGRATLRLSSMARFGSADGREATVTISAEQSLLREQSSDPDELGAPVNQPGAQGGQDYLEWQHDTGVVALVTAAFHRQLYLTGGVREERNSGLVGADRLTTLPTLGASYLAERGDVALKLRAAYGSGTRPPRTAAREASWGGRPAMSGELRPERQSGAEAGVDLLVGRRFSLHATGYDQLASGLIQRVGFAPADTEESDRRLTFQLQNVGEIRNRGWELQGEAHAGPFSVTAMLSGVESRVQRLAAGYGGDLRLGDRMLEVPGRTAGLTATWNGARWSATTALYGAWNWIGYDQLTLARDFADARRPSDDLVGDRLRSYWREYDGSPHLRAALARALGRQLSVVLLAENLLNSRRGEPDNAHLPPGRAVSAGLRATF